MIAEVEAVIHHFLTLSVHVKMLGVEINSAGNSSSLLCSLWMWNDEKEEFKHSGHIPFYIYISHFFHNTVTEQKYVSLMMTRDFPPLTVDVVLTCFQLINILHFSIHRPRAYLRPTGGYGIFSTNIGLVFWPLWMIWYKIDGEHLGGCVHSNNNKK